MLFICGERRCENADAELELDRIAEVVVIFMFLMLRYRCFVVSLSRWKYEHGNIEEGK